MNNQPLVSIIMTAYNAEEFIKSNIESVLNQIYTNFEFLIIDDCSSDRTLDIIKSFNNNRITLIENKENKGFKGYVENLNQLIHLAKGKYIARIDADDIWHPQKLQKQIEYLEENTHIFLIGSSIANKINQKGEKQGIINLLPKGVSINEYITKRNPILHPSIVFRNNNNSFYRWKLFYAEDYDFHLCNISKGLKYEITNEILMDYRVLEGSLSHQKNKLISSLFRNQASLFYKERLISSDDSYLTFNPEDIHNILNINYINKYSLLKTALHYAFIAGMKNNFQIIFNKIKKQYGKSKIPIMYKILNINFNFFYKLYNFK